MTLDDYLSQPGNTAEDLARKLGLESSSQVRQWRHGYANRRPSPTTCAEIERVTDGAVVCEDLRSDLTWKRVKDKAWPHPQGRPLLEVAATAGATP